MKKVNVKSMVLIALFVALIVMGAFISIPIGPVSITLQSLFVLLAGFFLGKDAYKAVLIYIVMGLIGLPLFAGFKGGFSTVFSPSFGFLIGMVIAAYFISFMFQRIEKINFVNALIIFVMASLILYVFGLPYMSYILNVYMGKAMTFKDAITKGMLVFLPGDLFKCFIAANIVSNKNIQSYKND